MTLIPVASIGHRWANTTHGLRQEPLYPASPRGESLRVWRVKTAGMNLRPCAAALGLKAVELSDLEAGRATLSDADWTTLHERCAKAHGQGVAP